MTEAEKKRLEGFLSKTLKIDTEEMASLYNEAGELTDLSIAEKADTERIRQLKSENDSQYKRGIKEGATKIEKRLKDKYEVDSDLEGVELVDFILGEKITEAKGKTDDITKHPEFIKSQRDFDKQLKAKDKEWAEKIEAKEKEHLRHATLAKIKERALVELDKMRPVLPEDARKAQRWKEKYLDEFSPFDYQEEDGNIIMLKDGQPVKDSHGHIMSFDDYAKETASGFFDFHAADYRSSAGNQSDQSKKMVPAPKNDEEYFERMKSAKTPDERIAIKESYENSKTK